MIKTSLYMKYLITSIEYKLWSTTTDMYLTNDILSVVLTCNEWLTKIAYWEVLYHFQNRWIQRLEDIFLMAVLEMLSLHPQRSLQPLQQPRKDTYKMRPERGKVLNIQCLDNLRFVKESVRLQSTCQHPHIDKGMPCDPNKRNKCCWFTIRKINNPLPFIETANHNRYG